MKKILLWILGIAVVGIVALGGVGYYLVNHTASVIHSNESSTVNTQSDAKTSQGKPVAYLLLGTDTGALGRDYKGRTDTMMVMVLNPKTKTTTMISLERDARIQLNGQNAKLNSVYAYGNANAAMGEVNQLLNIHLNGYMLVNMGGLKKIVDAVDGVNVTSPLTFSYEGYNFTQGQSSHLDGAKALAFSRMRYDDPQGDYGRQVRQQLVIEAIMNKAKDHPTSVLSTDFLNSVSENVRSNISLKSAKNLALKYKNASNNVKRDQMHGTGTMIDGVSYQNISNDEYMRIHNEITNALQAK